ncbi:hypothetical protein DAEQUDRAFT_741413 [Daedalea quercina L-15889]|uniref:Uncharacterized protein n=1 Tax=Daedalea quercina L-15889 TaxID=1314783 RepID=A0A165LD05_9APHY|nr:hypothetical protein DAEQUDRAFT_741413 [Daedalea quercina L-15889]
MNKTIDDFYGDSVTGTKPSYTEGWAYGPNCTTCTVTPDVDDLFDRSWHEVTAFSTDPYPENVTISFSGIAIWVYCVVPNFTNHSTGAISSVNVTFQLDGEMHGYYMHQPDGTDATFLYNVTVYSNTSLESGQHTLVMTPQALVGGTYLGFDWAQYTSGDIPMNSTSATSGLTSPTTGSPLSAVTAPVVPGSKSHRSVGAIAGGVIGGVMGALVIILLAFVLRRRARKRKVSTTVIDEEKTATQEAKSVVSPFPLPSLNQAGSSDEVREASSGLLSGNGAYEHTIHLRATSSPETDSSSQSAMSASPTLMKLHSHKASDTSSSTAPRSTSTVPPSPPANSEQTFASRMSPSMSDAAMSQLGELSRHIRDIEQTVSELRRRQSTDHRTTASLVTSAQPVAPGGLAREDAELRLEIAALQVEVERLRTEQAMLTQEAPPAYQPRQDAEVAEQRRGGDETPEPENEAARREE